MKTFYTEILAQIRLAAEKNHRSPEEIRLVGVTKYFPDTEEVRALYEAGCRDFGENRLQNLEPKADELRKAGRFPDLTWHFIGPLQRNKARRVLEIADWIHSGESLELLKTLDRLAAELGRKPHVLVEVNLGGEQNKHGFTPQGAREAWNEIRSLTNIRLEGFMGMTSLDATEAQAHAQFASLRTLRDELLPGGQLSMGMSHDFPIAIAEGATLVRIGTALYAT